MKTNQYIMQNLFGNEHRWQTSIEEDRIDAQAVVVMQLDKGSDSLCMESVQERFRQFFLIV